MKKDTQARANGSGIKTNNQTANAPSAGAAPESGAQDRLRAVQGIEGALELVNAEVERLMTPPEYDFKLNFQPFGPLAAPDGIHDARYFIYDVYEQACKHCYDDSNIISFFECARFHPGLRPELEALHALGEGRNCLVELGSGNNQSRLQRPMTEAEKHLAYTLKARHSEAPHDTLVSVLEMLIHGGYEDLLADNPSGKDTLKAVKGMINARWTMFKLKTWLDGL